MVVIATAIVPPLANTGLCFAVGTYAGGAGLFLPFFSNFLSILLVASLVFWFFGMTGQYHDLGKKVLIRRFSLPVGVLDAYSQVSAMGHNGGTILKS